MDVDVDLAEKAIADRVGGPLGITPLEAAAAIRRLVNAAMANAIRLMTVARGRDPRDLALMAFGGAGPVHAVDLAAELDMPWVVIPPHPGVTSAVGLAVSDIVHDHVRTVRGRLGVTDPEHLDALIQGMERAAIEELTLDRVPATEQRLQRSADLRYAGQGHALNIPVPDSMLDEDVIAAVARAFHDRHQERYGFHDSTREIEIANLRLRASGVSSRRATTRAAGTASQRPEPTATRDVYFSGQTPQAVPVLDRRSLAPGCALEGPCIVEQLDSTVVVPPEYRAKVDVHGNMIIGRELFAS
jgi:N-methylhydantoinase A